MSKTAACPYCDSQSHDHVEKCAQFKALGWDEKWDTAKELFLCFNCLLAADHLARGCPKESGCGENGCTRRHHSLLHKAQAAAGGDGERQDAIAEARSLRNIPA